MEDLKCLHTHGPTSQLFSLMLPSSQDYSGLNKTCWTDSFLTLVLVLGLFSQIRGVISQTLQKLYNV